MTGVCTHHEHCHWWFSSSVNLSCAVQEESFEFDQVYRDYGLGNPLLKEHCEYDEGAMHEGLTPDRYNRCAPNAWCSCCCCSLEWQCAATQEFVGRIVSVRYFG
jgi:hypothetical protein